MADPLTNYSLNEFFKSTPLGSTEQAIGKNLYGINHEQTPGMVPINKDSYGLTFFVRPQLNLQSDNIRHARNFYPLLSDNPLSIQRFVRTTLDPRLMYGYPNSGSNLLKCDVVDPFNAFIPVLTNNLNSISGWSDIVAPTFTSKEGVYGETHTMVDGNTTQYGNFDLDATFRNTKGDPITYLFYIWVNYSAYVFDNKLSPYFDFIRENTIDYNTRIYRLVLDVNKRYVKKIASTGISIPVTVPVGGFFDYSADAPLNTQNKDITIRFKCDGAVYFDDILVFEFNQTVIQFNPGMNDSNRKSQMVKLTPNLAALFNNMGYPRIDPNTYELEWYVFKDQFTTLSSAWLKTNQGDINLKTPMGELDSDGEESDPDPIEEEEE